MKLTTLVFANCRAERHNQHWPVNCQAIECNRVLVVQQYRFLRHHGLDARTARTRLFQSMFIGIAGGRYVANPKAVAA